MWLIDQLYSKLGLMLLPPAFVLKVNIREQKDNLFLAPPSYIRLHTYSHKYIMYLVPIIHYTSIQGTYNYIFSVAYNVCLWYRMKIRSNLSVKLKINCKFKFLLAFQICLKHMISINLTDEIGVKRDVFPWVYSYILWLYCVVFGLGAKAADPQTTTHLLHHLRNGFDFWDAFIVKFNVIYYYWYLYWIIAHIS